jgi:hypothetical protein
MSEWDLPPQIAEGARLEANEYGWEPALFPTALANAQALGYACIGGQFQFRRDIGIREMYWLSADCDPRQEAEELLPVGTVRSLTNAPVNGKGGMSQPCPHYPQQPPVCCSREVWRRSLGKLPKTPFSAICIASGSYTSGV